MAYEALEGGGTWHMAFHCMNVSIVERWKEMLTSMFDECARMLQDQFVVSMNHLHALALFSL